MRTTAQLDEYPPTESQDLATIVEIQRRQLHLLRLENDGLRMQSDHVATRHWRAQTRRLSILDLPVEITAAIFQHCCSDSRPTVAPRDCPLLLLRVCRSWHAIAVSTPGLWSDIDIQLRGGDISALARVVDSWLHRAGALPLTISLEAADNWRRVDAPALPSLLETLQ
uniref:F-box domain-containing protein n=1 Tax=Mycena chlorophos TaxID=658473 RepID=A0ABQ0L9F1_MYCCL|nr:predicted protein [Mycena chlorophos]